MIDIEPLLYWAEHGGFDREVLIRPMPSNEPCRIIVRDAFTGLNCIVKSKNWVDTIKSATEIVKYDESRTRPGSGGWTRDGSD